MGGTPEERSGGVGPPGGLALFDFRKLSLIFLQEIGTQKSNINALDQVCNSVLHIVQSAAASVFSDIVLP